MVELLTSSYAGRTGVIVDSIMGYYKVHWQREKDGSPCGCTYWVDKRNVKVIV
jgi:hypothetical protein